jgi:hypothetical protein
LLDGLRTLVLRGMRRHLHFPTNQSGPRLNPPRKAPPWFASQKQYEDFLKLTARDLGPTCLTATSIEVEHLDEERRKEILSGYALIPTLRSICSTYAALDASALYSREPAFESQFVRKLSGDLADKVTDALRKGNRFMPPSALNQLIREVIEWCADDADESLGAVGRADFVHLVLSINGEQEAQDRPEFFDSWPPSQAEIEAYNEAMTNDDEMVLQELQRMMLQEFARMQTLKTTVPAVVLGDTYDMWFKPWSRGAQTQHDLIGDSPEEAFLNATKVPLLEVIRMGLLLWDRTKKGAVAISASWLETAVDPAALGLLRSSAALPVKEYRKQLAKERKKGNLAHRRYAFTESPLIEVADGEYIVLRPTWVLDRFCGSMLYWQAFFEFGLDKTPEGRQFSQAMNYIFEAAVDYLFRRATRRANGAIILISEEQMQEAWTTGGEKPSVCDWALVCGTTCVLVDATNHWLDEKTAQGFADPEDYQADLEETFVNKKFEQLKSTMELLKKHGWEGCTFDDNTVYVPLVVVPNAGIPATVSADIDVKLRAGNLGPNVRSPGILVYHELQVFEGVCEHRKPMAFANMLEEWRSRCTASQPVRPQTYLDLMQYDRPMGKYISTGKRRVLDKLGPSTPEV